MWKCFHMQSLQQSRRHRMTLPWSKAWEPTGIICNTPWCSVWLDYSYMFNSDWNKTIPLKVLPMRFVYWIECVIKIWLSWTERAFVYEDKRGKYSMWLPPFSRYGGWCGLQSQWKQGRSCLPLWEQRRHLQKASAFDLKHKHRSCILKVIKSIIHIQMAAFAWNNRFICASFFVTTHSFNNFFIKVQQVFVSGVDVSYWPVSARQCNKTRTTFKFW